MISEYVYGYDNNRNIAKQTASGEIGGSVSTYSYAPGEQLTKAVYDPAAGETITKDWTYDRNSNRLTETVQEGAGPADTTTWTYRLDNSIGTQDGPASGTEDLRNYQYNDRGLLTNDGCATTSYDVFDRTTSVAVNNTAECGGDDKTSTYTYDGLDRQRSAQVTGADEGNTTTRSAYDGLSSTVVGQVNAVNGTHSDPTVLYQLDPGGDAMAYEQTVAAGGKAFLDTDGHGNVTAITTNSGALACAVVYDPYGTPLDPATGADANDVCKSGGQSDTTGNAAWYRGLVRDGTTGTYQLGTRTYDPSTGAFTSPDAYRVSSPSTDLSVGVDPLTANTYVYVNGNPLNAWDPNGHRVIEEGGGGGGERLTPEELELIAAEYERDRLLAEQAELEEQIAENEAAADVDVTDLLIDAFGELSGLNDAIECFNDPGFSGACIATAVSLFGFSFSMASKVKKLIDVGDTIIDAVRLADNAADAVTDLRAGLDNTADALRMANAQLADARRALKQSRSVDNVPTKTKTNPNRTSANKADNHSCAGYRSFSGDTLVLMADGSYKPISKIKIGDWVIATDPETGKQVPKKVTRLWVHQDNLLDLIIDADLDGDGQLDRITTTEDHPFWNATDRQWQDIQDFDTGDDLITDQWRRIDVVGLDPGTTHTGLAYNLTVQGIHTYHVGHANALVHNCGVSQPAHAANGADEVAQVTKNRIAGNEFRDSVAARLEAEEGFAVLGKEVGVKTPFGWRYLDILAQRNGGLVNFETKLGGSRYLPSQRAKDWWISRVGVDLGDGSLTQIPTVLIRGPLS